MKSLHEQVMTTSKGLVFDIKHFAVHDGKGIRTTVFFKGCSLRCAWCQNPEGLSPKRQVIWLSNKCMHCQQCVKPGKITFEEDEIRINRQSTESFDEEINGCPMGALRYDSTEYTVNELVEKLLKDEVFYHNGGGVTFSGGEPLLHAEFIEQVCVQLRSHGIHTAIETALNVPLEDVQRVIPHIDEIYCDFKISDPEKFRKYTNGNLSIVRRNMQWILKHYGNRVTIRTPLIPGVTDSKENIQHIAEQITQVYPEVRYELLNYNELAPSKYKLIDEKYPLGELKRLSSEQFKELQNYAVNCGIKNMVR